MNIAAQTFCICFLLFTVGVPAHAVSEWVQTGVTGRLIYTPDAEGDRILDFSNVGYKGKGAALIPDNVVNAITLSPVAGDDTASVQAAINSVGAMPLGPDGYRGAVLLNAGTYDINSQLEIRDSGVVLRGVGQGANDTVLHGRNVGAAGTNQRPLLRVYGNGNRSNVGSTRNMIDKVVPAGSRSFRVNSTSGFAVGDTVYVERPSSQAWIDAVGMDNPPNGDPPWVPGTMNIRYDRVITRIEGDRVFVDAPLANAFELQYGGGTIREYSWSGAIENIGIENLRGDTDFANSTDEDHAWEFISIGGTGATSDRAQNVWVRDISARHFGDSAVVANPSSKWVTVSNADSQDPISVITGSRRYTYDLSGHLGFVTGSTADEGRHDFVTNSTRPPGPSVFHNSTATNANNDSGPHQRWSSGTLYDIITVNGDAINVRFRGSFGTSHGWSGANVVVWNSTADSYRVQNPPTAQNWLIGSTGTIVEDTTFGPQPSGHYDSHGTPVTVGGTTSLYDAQSNDAADIRQFHWSGGNANWTTDLEWDRAVKPGVYEVSMRDYLIGDIDGYLDDGAGDDVFVDPIWANDVATSSANPLTNMDELTGNQNVTFTIQTALDSGERVVHGSLALALRQSGGVITTDFVRLFDFDSNHKLDFSTLGWDTEINAVDTFVGVVDLGNFLDELQTGDINVQLNDDTGLDWALYTATVATPIADPIGPMVFLDGGGSVTVDTNIDPVGGLQLGGGSITNLIIDDTGQVDVTGDYLQSSDGTLTIDIAGTSPGQFGMIASDNDAILAGKLEVSLDGYSPSLNDSFSIITALGNVVSTFDSDKLPALAAGLTWDISYGSSVVLTVVSSALDGDYNVDGIVDAADYTVWLANLGSTTNLAADGDGSGSVDTGDYNIWKTSFGTSGSGSGSASGSRIPEPSGMLLLLIAFVGMVYFQRNQRSRPGRELEKERPELLP